MLNALTETVLLKVTKMLDEIRETIDVLVKIANGEDIKLTQRQAYLAVRVMDLTEGFIALEDFTASKWQKFKK